MARRLIFESRRVRGVLTIKKLTGIVRAKRVIARLQ